MFKKLFLYFLFTLIITSCSTAPKKSAIKNQVLPKLEQNKFIGLTNIEGFLQESTYQKKFIVASPDNKKFAEFNTYFQLGILAAKEEYKIQNEISFIRQENLDLNTANKNFLIGPISNEIVSDIDGLLLTNKALFLNDSVKNLSISLSQKSQDVALDYYLRNKGVKRVGFIKDADDEKNNSNSFRTLWFNNANDAITIEVGEEPSARIENFLDVTESKDRFNLVDNASFSDVGFVPRARKDFKHIVIFPENLTRLYELASLVRFNYGLDYELFSFTSNFNQKIDTNEVSLHDITLIDHTYENKYGFDLTKSRSFCLGYDAMLLSFAIANNITGEIRGLLGIYELSPNQLVSRSYIN
jgi:hypothetical protein